MTPERQTILVVDDEKNNRALLASLLKQEFRVILAKSGEQALGRAREHLPDLILLDVLMPGMDGHDVIRMLKADAVTRDIPVIFITALDKDVDQVRAFELGGVDYIHKPFRPEVIKARVRTHLSLRAALKQLEGQKRTLEEAAALRDDVDGIMRHDLKGPLNGMLGAVELLMEESEGFSEEQRRLLRVAEKSGYTMLEMINRSLDLYKMERGLYRFQPAEVDLLAVTRRVLEDNLQLAGAHKVTVELSLNGHAPLDDDGFPVAGELTLCYSLLSNLVRNAFEASPTGGIVTIAMRVRGGEPVWRIDNAGVVPEEIRERFFDKFATAGKRGGTGLGTYSARLMARTMGGDIGFTSSERDGTAIEVHFPPSE